MSERTAPIAHAARLLVRDWFLMGMIAAVVLAVLFPWVGRAGGPMHADVVSDVGIFFVFLLHGLGLSPQAMRLGMSRWRLHVLVQAFTFGVFPVLWLVLDAAVGRWVPAALSLGFLYLAATPSTISSSVAMTGVARGNVPGAIFNASLSSLLGIALTPFLLEVLGHTKGETLPLGQSVVKLATLLLLPLVVGQVLRPILGERAAAVRKHTHGMDRAVILLLVYASFCDTISSGSFSRYGVGTLALTALGAALLLGLVLWLTRVTSRAAGFSKEDEIAAVFCGSKKSLVSGMPMARLLFGAHPALGLIVLPLILYHQIQLFVCAVVAERYASRPH